MFHGRVSSYELPVKGRVVRQGGEELLGEEGKRSPRISN